MCGICGFTGRGSKEILHNMGMTIYHRGPDAEGMWQNDYISLCSRRLSIVDLQGGVQPASDESGKVHLIWNGEIYNHPELKSELEDRGHIFKTNHSDTEVLMHMYLEYGTKFVDRLNGMFAIAIWDERIHRLYLFRDRMGVKPLYYAINGESRENVIFASEIKTILSYPSYVPKINERALYQYFSFKNTVAPETVYSGIEEVLAGQYIEFEVDDDGARLISKEIYWKLSDYYGMNNRAEDRDIREIVGQTEWLIKDAVKIRMCADVEVGAFLSGGLDSSLICAMASQYTDKLRVYTLDQRSEIHDCYDKKSDVKSAVELSHRYDFNQTIHSITAYDVVDQLDKIIVAFDQPFSGAISAYMLSEVMGQKIKTALSGDGADELFGSYLPHMMAFPMEYYSKFSREHKGIPHSDMLKQIDYSKLRPMDKEVSYMDAVYKATGGVETEVAIKMLLLGDDDKSLFLTDRFYEMAEDNSTEKLVKRRWSELAGTDTLNRYLEYDSGLLLPNQVLKYVDTQSMAHSLEVRCPFLDYRLVEYLAGISGRVKMHDGQTKSILRKVASSYLPDDITNRKKEGFVMPVNDWLQSELKSYVTDVLSMDRVARHGYLKPEMVYYILQTYYADTSANGYLAGIIWNFVCFQKWCDLTF